MQGEKSRWSCSCLLKKNQAGSWPKHPVTTAGCRWWQTWEWRTPQNLPPPAADANHIRLLHDWATHSASKGEAWGWGRRQEVLWLASHQAATQAWAPPLSFWGLMWSCAPCRTEGHHIAMWAAWPTLNLSWCKWSHSYTVMLVDNGKSHFYKAAGTRIHIYVLQFMTFLKRTV